MSATLFLGQLPSWQVWCVAFVGLAFMGLTLLVGRRVLGARSSCLPGPGSQTGSRPDPFVLGSTEDQRKWWRRPGNGVEVLFGDVDAPALSGTASLVDRSPGGLCLRTAGPVEVGTLLLVRARQAPASLSSVRVEVKSCRNQDGGWLLGCEFLRPAWNDLFQFA